VSASSSRPDGERVPEPRSPGLVGWRFANTHTDVAEVLEVIGPGRPLEWGDLYKIDEIIHDAIKPDKIAARGWTDKPNRFGVHSAR
jgi:hypothetical protein